VSSHSCSPVRVCAQLRWQRPRGTDGLGADLSHRQAAVDPPEWRRGRPVTRRRPDGSHLTPSPWRMHEHASRAQPRVRMPGGQPSRHSARSDFDRDRVDDSDPTDDVQLPQLHRRRSLEALVRVPGAFARQGRDSPCRCRIRTIVGTEGTVSRRPACAATPLPGRHQLRLTEPAHVTYPCSRPSRSQGAIRRPAHED
jgi:hypothetical protein